MKNDKEDQSRQVDQNNQNEYPAGRSDEGGNFLRQRSGDKHFNPEATTEHRSEKDPQGSSMGLGSQPAAVNLDRGEGKPAEQQDKPGKSASARQDDTGSGEGNTNTTGYGASNNAAGV